MKIAQALKSTIIDALLALNRSNRIGSTESDPTMIDLLQDLTEYLLAEGYEITDLYDFMYDRKQEIIERYDPTEKIGLFSSIPPLDETPFI